jgi:PH (Pleckstrin Homology) domain-containing protein
MSGPIPIRHVEPDQDAEALQKVARDVAKILTPTEEILYIATQNATALSIRKDSVVVTTNRIIGFSPGVLGRVSFNDFQWQDVLDVSMKQGMLSTEIVISTAAGQHEVGAIDKEQAKRLYGIAQQLEQEWREKRRVREIEEARAKAGGVYMGTLPGQPAPTTAAPAEDAVAKLAKAKAMLDQNLISDVEYEALKAKVLAEF